MMYPDAALVYWSIVTAILLALYWHDRRTP
jgi:hypothetical protein